MSYGRRTPRNRQPSERYAMVSQPSYAPSDAVVESVGYHSSMNNMNEDQGGTQQYIGDRYATVPPRTHDQPDRYRLQHRAYATVPYQWTNDNHANDFEPAYHAHAMEYNHSMYTTSNHSAVQAEPVQENDDSQKPIMATSVREDRPRHISLPDTNMRAVDIMLNKFTEVCAVKSWLHWTNKRRFHRDAVFSTRAPGSYQAPSEDYRSAQATAAQYKHLDVFRRGKVSRRDDYYLDPLNGKLRKLFVQTIDEVYERNSDSHSWRRTYIRNISPRLIRLAWWPFANAPTSRSSHRLKVHGLSRVNSRTTGWDQSHWTQVGLRWLPACIGLLIVMCVPQDVEGQVRNHGFYDPVPYRFWSYPTSARNMYENRECEETSGSRHTLLARRHLPRYLCFLDSISRDNPRGKMKPEDWMAQTGRQPSYIFISYTGEQWKRACAQGWEQIQANGVTRCSCTQCQAHRLDVDALHALSRRAAEDAEVEAYWTDQNCMSVVKDEQIQDVYGICDVTRGAELVVIVVGQSGVDRLPDGVHTGQLLKEHGTRMWTYPEILLSPVGKKIRVYTRGSSQNAIDITKTHYASQVWSDADTSRQLIDHFENTLTLSRLELVVTALECLVSRVHEGTTRFRDGDLAYALMGLLRQRPKVEPNDSAFQAFARLSLSNDSDQLLERMICLLTDVTSEDQRRDRQGALDSRHWWTNLNDHWSAKLWDIEPLCQVSGIAANDTVILDGAFGATITWDSFQRVAITTKETWSRTFARSSVRSTPLWFFVALLTLGLAAGSPTTTAIGVILLLIAIVLILLSPQLILHVYSGKVWNAQPWLFGFEGYMDLEEIEKKIFGFPCERLNWSPYSSSLSRHHLNTEFLPDECEGTTPLLDGENSQAGYSSTTHDVNGMRLFTVVDTHTMTVSTFRAEKPPVVALLCGSEGGMQRAVLCSYDWTTSTFYRETVLRMETRMLDRTPRIGRVRFGMKRPQQQN